MFHNDAAKAVFWGKFIAVNDHIKKIEQKWQINNLAFHLKKLENEEHTKPKETNMEIVKIIVEILNGGQKSNRENYSINIVECLYVPDII